jgi:hypothetical protein
MKTRVIEGGFILRMMQSKNWEPVFLSIFWNRVLMPGSALMG